MENLREAMAKFSRGRLQRSTEGLWNTVLADVEKYPTPLTLLIPTVARYEKKNCCRVVKLKTFGRHERSFSFVSISLQFDVVLAKTFAHFFQHSSGKNYNVCTPFSLE